MATPSGKFYVKNLRKLNAFLKQYSISPESPTGDVGNWRVWKSDWLSYKYIQDEFDKIPHWDEVMETPIFRGKVLLLEAHREYGIVNTTSIINNVKTSLDVWTILENAYFVAYGSENIRFITKLSIVTDSEFPTLKITFKRV